MRAGLLNKYVTIEYPIESQNSVGQPIKTWTEINKVWAAIQPLRADELLAAQQINGKATVKLRIRAGCFFGILYSAENYIDDPFDLTDWTKIGTPQLVNTSDDTPTGCHQATKITDNDLGSVEGIYKSNQIDYVHGDAWTANIFIKKSTVSANAGVYVIFTGGAEGSEINLFVNKLTGSSFTSSTNATITASHVQDYDVNWWRATISGFSTTSGTTTVLFLIYPHTLTTEGNATVFLPALMKGTEKGPTVLSALTGKMRINWNGKIYNIEGPPVNLYERNREMHLMCSEGVNDG